MVFRDKPPTNLQHNCPVIICMSVAVTNLPILLLSFKHNHVKAYPRAQSARGAGNTPRQVASHTHHFHTSKQFNMCNQPKHACSWTGGGNRSSQSKATQTKREQRTLHRTTLSLTQQSSPGPSCCEATAITTHPPLLNHNYLLFCHLKLWL